MQLFVFRNRTKSTKYAHYLQNWMKIEWFMSPLYYKQIINNLSAAITKKDKNKRRSRKSLVCSHKTLHSFIFFYYQSCFHDWSMWSVRLSDRRKQFIFVLIGSFEYFLHVGVKPEQILQSCPVVARYAEELDAALAIYIQHLLSCNRSFWGSSY